MRIYKKLSEVQKEIGREGFDSILEAKNLPDGVYLYCKCLGHWNDDPKILEHACIFLTSIPTTDDLYGCTSFYFRAYKTKNVANFLTDKGYKFYNEKDFDSGGSWRESLNSEINKNRISNDTSLRI